MNNEFTCEKHPIQSPVACLLLCTLLLSGCSGTALKNIPPAQFYAIKHNQQGVTEEVAGNSGAALSEFSEALRLHASMENMDGMVIVLINIARTHRLSGDIVSAKAAIERASTLLAGTSGLADELWFEKAKIFLATGDLATAKEYAVKAAGAEETANSGRRLNLVGIISLRQGLLGEARSQAEKALQLNITDGAEAEIANSYKLLAEICTAREEYGQAADWFSKALAADKTIGEGKKIAADLRGLALIAEKRKDLPGAIGYYQRALDVSLSCKDLRLAALTTDLLAKLYRESGQPLLAEKMDSERTDLLKKISQ
jgi:tetratricopeptide (TPR) repeat protein